MKWHHSVRPVAARVLSIVALFFCSGMLPGLATTDVSQGSLDSSHKGTIDDIAYDRARGILATVGSDGTLRIWNEETGRLLQRIAVTRGNAESVCLNPSTDQVAIGVSNGSLTHRIEVWDWVRSVHQYTVILRDSPLFIRFSRGGDYLLCGESRGESFQVLRSSDGSPVPGFHAPGMTGFAALAQDEDTLTTYDLSGTLSLRR